VRLAEQGKVRDALAKGEKSQDHIELEFGWQAKKPNCCQASLLLAKICAL
jgi:hypothetical protein